MHAVYEERDGFVFDLYDRGPILLTMIRTLLINMRMHTAPSQATSVHFHQGPQGQPTPCFDERCPNPRLSA
jgi:hypothetical protein